MDSTPGEPPATGKRSARAGASAARPGEPAPSAASGPTQTIRVIEVRRALADPATASADELALALAAADPPLPAAVVRAALDLGRTLQGPLAPLLYAAPAAPGVAALDAVRARELLASPAVLPVIAARGAAATADRPAEGQNVRTRPASRVRAVAVDGGDAALAAEEPVEVSAFAVDPAAAGAAVVAALGSGAFLGEAAWAASGACPPAVLAAAGPVRPPEGLAEPARAAPPKLEVVRLGAGGDVIGALLRRAQAAAGFYLSGAAAATALARVAAAARGAPGAEPGLLAAVGPALADLSAIAVPRASPAAAGAAPWRSPADEDRLRYFLGRLTRTALVVSGGPDARAFDLSPLADLYRVGALGAYLFALTEGRDSPRLEAFLEREATWQARAAQLATLEHSVALAASRARQYLAVVADKFGAARAAAVRAAVRADEPDVVLAALAPRERELVLAEFENRRRALAAAAANRCPHVRLAQRLRAAPTAEAALAALDELDKYLAKPAAAAPPAWLACRSCDFQALCPHVRDRVRLEARRAPFEEVRTRLLRYAVRAGAGDARAYYCAVCAERLADADGEDRVAEIVGRFGDLDSGLRSRVWAAALAAARHVRFPAPTDERQFAGAAADVVYPLLLAAEAAVEKKGRRRAAAEDPSELDPRTQLYVLLFVYAYVLSLVDATRAARGQEVGFEGVKPGAKFGAYAEAMLRRIAEGHRGLLAQIEGVTAEYVRARFAEAYRLVRGEAGGPLAAADPAEELAVQLTTLDPAYRFAAAAARVAGDLARARPAGPAEARRELELVLGASLPEAVRLAREAARDPALAGLFLRRAGGEVPPGGELEWQLKGPRVNLYARLYEPAPAGARAAIAAFLAVPPPPEATRMQSWVGAGGPPPKRRGAKTPAKGPARPADKTHGRPAEAAGKGKGVAGPQFRRPDAATALAGRGCYFEAYRLFAKYTKSLTGREVAEEYAAELALARRAEDGLRLARAAEAIKTYYDFGFARPWQPAEAGASRVGITALYDEDGRRHRWARPGTYYYAPAGAGPDAELLEVTGGVDGVKKARMSGALAPSMVLVDVACPVCGVRASRAAGLDADKTWRAVRMASELDAFYVFYEARCPAGELHDWDPASAACRKCGRAAAGASGATRRAYYDKYAAAFATERRVVVAPPTAAAPAAAASTAAADGLAAAWRADYTLIVRAAELAGVRPAVIEAIGATERRDYEDVVEGRDAPPPPTSSEDHRIVAADAEVRFFLGEYGTLRHAQRLAKPPPGTLELLGEAAVPRHEWGALPAALPDVNRGYRDTFTAIQRTRPPADALAFAIQSLCRMALEVAELGRATGSGGATGAPDWVPRLAAAFVKKTLGRILRGQKLLSKPGPFNWGIFEAPDDEDVVDQVGDVGEDVMTDLLTTGAEEAAFDPFSGENMDYDTSESNPNNEAA